MFVVVGHVISNRAPRAVGVDAVNVAALGVQIFFVLSGFLITTLLVREQERTGRISVRNFYIRRILRLWAPLYAMLLGMALLGAVGASAVTSDEILAAGLHIFNYSGIRTSTVGHVWSLAVEEHFYLLFPAAFVFLRRRALIRVCGTAVILSPFVRMASYVLAPGSRDLASQQTHNRIDALLIGCLLSLCWTSPQLQRILRWGTRHGLLIAGLAVLAATVRAESIWHGRFMFPVGYTLQALIIAVVIGGLQLKEGWLRRRLDGRVLVRLGVISYSVYLWQQIFTQGDTGHWWTLLPIALLGPILVGELSYRLIEAPLAKVRNRFR